MDNSTSNSDGHCNITKTEKQKQIVVEALWLQYLNDSLLKEKLITSTTHRQMRLKISLREQEQLKKLR